MIPRYRVEGMLGTGPDGAISRVVSERLGARPAAARVLPVPAGPGRALLRNHAEVLGGLGHPHLADVVDIVDVDDERVVLVTELAEHGTLADRLASGPLPPDEAAGVVASVADAMVAAHGAGITHRRLHAGNVLMTIAGPAVTDLVQAAAVGRTSRSGDAAADDLADLVRLARLLPDGLDVRTAAFAAVCDAADAGAITTFDELVAGLRDAVAHRPPPAPPPPAPHLRADGHGPGRSARLGIVAAAAVVVGACLGAAVTTAPDLVRDGATPLEAEQATPPTAPTEATTWSATGTELTRTTESGPVRYRVGDPGDLVVVGDWDCDGTATPGVYRPATGETFHFDGWADDEALVAAPGDLLEPAAEVSVRSEGGCDRIVAASS